MKESLQDEIESEDFAKLFSIMLNRDLAKEFFAYVSEEDKNSEEYSILLDEISKRNSFKNSFENWAKKYNLTKTAEKDMEFYKTLDLRGLSPEESKISSLRNALKDVYNYSRLWAGTCEVEFPDGEKMQKGFRKRLENINPEVIRRFSIDRYYNGEKIYDRLTKS